MRLEAKGKAPGEQPGLAPAQVFAQLDRILASTPFRTSKRCSDLLRHVVHAVCEGHSEHLKERTLGIAVFERDPDYDTNQDPVVRNTAGQVRKRLAQYYLEPGREDELRIDLPAGAYVPQIHQPHARIPEPALPPLPVREPKPWRLIAVASTAVLLALAVAGFLLANRHVPTDVERFWAPMLRRPGPIVLCVGQGHTYKLKGDLDRLFEDDSAASDRQPPSTRTIPLNDLVPVWDRTIGINDARTLVRFTALFSGFGKAVQFRGGRSTELDDLRGKPVVLIGAFNNSWTLSLTGELRFYFDEDLASHTYMVRDRLHPKMLGWDDRSEQQTDHSDYALVSRVFNPTTEQPVVVAAGIQGGGTAAAGEFLTNSIYLGAALKGAPAHWETRNLQFVLKTRLLSGTAGPPELVAAHYW